MKPLFGPCDSYQLEPFSYPWAWDMARHQENNNWAPEEIQVGGDIADYQNPAVPDSHRHIFESVMAQLTTFDIERGDDAAETFLQILQPAELKHFLKRLVWDECVVAGTEVLSQRGWIPVEQLSYNDSIAQWHPDQTLSWTQPIKISATKRDTSIVISTTNTLCQHVTIGHRVPYWTDKGMLRVKCAEKLTANGHAKHPLSGVLSTTLGPHLLSMQERFLVALQADGSISPRYTGERCGTVPICFSLKKSRKQKRLEEILAGCQWEYSTRVDSKERKVYTVNVPTTQPISKTLADWIDLKVVSAGWAQDFIEEVSYWDAHRVSGYARIEYMSTQKDNTDTVCALAVLAGYAAKVVRVSDDRSETFSDVYWAYINKNRPYAKGSSLQINRLTNPNTFYGVEVPSTFLLIRYKGYVSVTGNCVHTRSYRYCIENLGVPVTGPNNIYDRWKQVDVMRKRVLLAQKISEPLVLLAYSMATTAEPLTIRQQKQFLRAAVFWFLIFEGVWFWMNLSGPVQALKRIGHFANTAEQFQYILRDEQQHVLFGVDLIRELLKQYPEVIDGDMLALINSDIKYAVQLEDEFISYVLSKGSIIGYSETDHRETTRFLANMRMRSIGLPEPFVDPRPKHRFPWFSEVLELKKEKNFFETRVTDYQTGGALDFGDTKADNFESVADNEDW